MRLRGRVALVTGASRGIGRAVALAFGREGAKAVAVHYRERRRDAEQVVGDLKAMGIAAHLVRADVADPEAAQAMVDEVAGRFGRLDILVNNAGFAQRKPFLDTAPDEWNRMMAVHLGGSFACAKAAVPHMLRSRWGRIVNISSIWGVCGAAGEVAYSAAKAGLIGFTKALALELGRSGITVNALAPGVIDTEMLADLDPDSRRELEELTPLGRLGRPDEVARAAAFLASADASFLTGQVLSQNGGIRT